MVITGYFPTAGLTRSQKWITHLDLSVAFLFDKIMSSAPYYDYAF